MSEDQEFFDQCQNISSDAPVQISYEWKLFELGRKAGYHSSQPDIVLEAEDEARGIMLGIAAEKFMSGMTGDAPKPDGVSSMKFPHAGVHSSTSFCAIPFRVAYRCSVCGHTWWELPSEVMRSPEEVREKAEWSRKDIDLDERESRIYWDGYHDALKWVLREE